MPFPLIHAEGSVPTWGAAGLYNTLLSRLSPNTATLTGSSDAQDVTPIGGANRIILPGLGQWSASIAARWAGTPRLGNVGLVAFSAGGYTLHVESWSLTVETEALDITRFNATNPTWRLFRPSHVQWSGTITARVDDATALANLHIATDSSTATALPTLTLTYGEDATANTLAGSVMLNTISVNQSPGALTTVEYGFTGTGALTAAGTNTIFPAGAVGTFLWDQLGATTNTLLTLTAGTGRTYSGSAFLRSLTMTCAVGDPVEVSIEAQGSGVLTIA